MFTLRTTKLPKVSHLKHKSYSTLIQHKQQLFVWGRGDHGQLGLGSNTTLCIKPQAVDLSQIFQKNEQVNDVVCGMNHTILTTNHGAMFSFGVNEHGELGLNDVENRWSPTRIEYMLQKPPTLVACGGHHTLCTTNSSEGRQVYVWGKNTFGQLGVPKCVSISQPQEIRSLRGEFITAVSAGDEFSTIATSQEIIVFGRCDVGQNGHGVEQESSVARIPLRNVIKLSSGWGHTLALTKDGSVWSWGANLHAQCGTGQKTVMSELKQLGVANIKDIACGSCHSILLSHSGEVYIFGSAADGKMLARNSTDVLIPQMIPGLGKVISIASGSDHLAVLGDDGSLRLWGFGQHGVIGTGELDIFNTPQKLSSPSSGTVFSSVSCSMDTTFGVVSRKAAS